MNLAGGPVAVGALGELIATAVAAAAGRAWKSLRGSPEARAVRNAIDVALTGALRDAVLPADTLADDAWVTEVAQVWRAAFTPVVSAALVACLADPSKASADRFAELARQALVDSGCDLAVLGRTFWVDEFVAALPRRLFSSLSRASLHDDGVRGLVDHLLRQRGDARAREDDAASPREFQRDLIALLRGLDAWARTGRLPTYLPAGADAIRLSRTISVRQGIRPGLAGDPAMEVSGYKDMGGMYLLPTEHLQGNGRPWSWPEVASQHRRLVVLGDPGMGKSWLIRTETHRLCGAGLARAAADPSGVIIPIPLRCDQLVGAPGQDLADKTAGYLVAQGLLPMRSHADLAAKVRAGRVVLLLDALDELTWAQSGPVREVLQAWAEQASDGARFVITSRIAGYIGSPVPDAYEVELLGFTSADTAAVVKAWHLPPVAAARLLDRVSDPAVAAMARVPLLLALMCSLAAQLSADEALPRTRGQLLGRVLRWFLTRAYRSPGMPVAPTLDDIDVEGLLEILAPLAFTFATQPAGWVDLMPGERLLDAIRTAGPAFTERGRPAAEVLRELSVRAGVLVPASNPSAGRSTGYLFFHRALAEYLVAHYMAALPEPGWLAIVDQHRWFDLEWAEVIPILGERLDSAGARKLMEHLLDVDADPFHQSLLTATRVWGARPDTDQLLPAARAEEVAKQIVELFRHQTTRAAVTSHLTLMAYLPRPLLSNLLALLGEADGKVRLAAMEALRSRDEPGVTEGLLGLVGDPDEDVRQALAHVLPGRKGLDVTEGIVGLIGDSNTLVQFSAIRALAGREGLDVTESLLSLLGDSDWIGLAAAQALAGRDGPDVTEALLGLLSHRVLPVRIQAMEALAGREEPGVTEALLNLISDPVEDVRGAAVRAVGGREGPGVTEALLSLLGDPVEDVRVAAIRAVAARQGSEVTGGLLGRLDDPDWLVRVAAVRAVADREGRGVTEGLVDRLGDPDWLVRLAAAEALAGREGPGVTEGLLGVLGDPEGEVRAAAAWTLAAQERRGVTGCLLGRLDDPNRLVRAAAAEALAGRRGPSVTEGLLGVLGDPEGEVRAAAAEALAGRGGPGVTEGLLGLLHDPDRRVRAAAVRTLAGRGGSSVTEGLLGVLDDRSLFVRLAVPEALASRDGTNVTEGLLHLLGDPDRFVRAATARVLASREGSGVTESLLDLLGDADRFVRSTAAKALASRDEAAPALLTWVRETRGPEGIDLPLLVDLAERLMIRNFRRIEPSKQPEVRAALARLTALH
jgi:HEAT repeat protein